MKDLTQEEIIEIECWKEKERYSLETAVDYVSGVVGGIAGAIAGWLGNWKKDYLPSALKVVNNFCNQSWTKDNSQ